MRPKRLQLQGFGAFRERTDIDFDGIDLVAFVGATGAGKSTIIDAITFALYGAVARYDDNRIVGHAINQTSQTARVQLDFEVGGIPYTAVRVVRRTTGDRATTSEARLERGDVVLASEARPMNTVVEELLGLDVEQFNRTVVLPQGRFAAFLHDTPANRQATLRQLLGVEIYQRLGQAARRRAEQARASGEALRRDVDAEAADLTDDHRRALKERIVAVGDTRRTLDQAIAVIDGLRQRLAELDRTAVDLDRRVQLLAGVEIPSGLDDLDERVEAAVASERVAKTELDDARGVCRAAADAAAAGPDLSESQLMLDRRRTETRLSAEHDAALTKRGAAQDALAAARTAADRIAAEQAVLDASVDAARATEEQVRADVENGPQRARIDAWRRLHGQREAALAKLAIAEARRDEAAAAVQPLIDGQQAAAAAQESARVSLDAARRIAGAGSLADLLAVGEPCPVCRQPVHEVPAHDPASELAEATARLEQVATLCREADERRQAAYQELSRAGAEVDAQRSVVDQLDHELANAPGMAVLDEQHDEAIRLRSALDDAAIRVQQAVTAARLHRDDPANVEARAGFERANVTFERLDTTVSGLAERLAVATAGLVGAPSERQLDNHVAEAKRLANEQQAAQHKQQDAAVRHDAALAVLQGLQDEQLEASAELSRVRDGLAGMGPPALEGPRALADWTTLVTWADALHLTLQADHRQALAAAQEQRDSIDSGEREARSACATVLEEDVDDVALNALRDRLVSHEAAAAEGLRSFDEKRERLATRRRQIADHEEAEAVAAKLGHLLRTDGFEGWLMESVMAGLVDAASMRLLELSGGQFSLVLDDRAFAVRDHGNADEVRNAKTLSGGETFLASLSLALALADATAELAAEGAPPIESIFLDEGFGTLDPTTLDTVAAAIEELGADGRMVGIVTHIRELADRMPVRLEITKTGSTSTVQRVEL